MTIFCRGVFLFLFSTFIMASSVELPIIKSVGSLVITQVKIGEKDYQFLLDTGSNANFLSAETVKSLGKTLERAPEKDTFVNTFGGRQKSEAYKLTLKLGGFEFPKMLSYVMNTKKFNEDQDGINCCDGILGIDFLKDNFVQVNLAQKKITISNTFKKKNLKGWKRIPIKMVGKNIISFKCEAGGSSFNFRLDSGNEIPIIFHTHKVDDLLLREQMFSQGYQGAGLPFFHVENLKCGEVKTPKVLSTYFYGAKGALTHKFVDGNVGSHILGKNYILDLKNGAIWVKGEALDFKIGTKTYKYLPDFKFQKGHRSIIHQAVSLIVNSCAEASAFQDCVRKLCSIEGKKLCVFKETRKNFDDFVKYQYPVQTRDCSIPRLVQELRFRPVQYNYCWYKLSEVNQAYYPKKFKPIELKGHLAMFGSQVSLLEVSNPVSLTRDFYCYAVSQGIINERTLPATMFGLSVKGLTLSKKSLSFYRDWMKTPNGVKCQELVLSTVGEKPSIKLESYFDKEYLALVNPYTILGDGVRQFDESYRVTVNHELLHAIYALSPKAKKLAKSMWEGLKEDQKESFKKAHPSYDFENETILYREYFAYFYQSKPQDLRLQ